MVGPYDGALDRHRPAVDLQSDRGLTSSGARLHQPLIEREHDGGRRSRSSSFVKMCPMWVFTVPSLMNSVDPISALLAPRPMTAGRLAPGR